MSTITVTNRIQSSYSTVTTQLWITDCATCGIVFAMPKALEERRREDRKDFYCPQGHVLVFRKSTADKLNEQLEAEKRRAARYERQRDLALDDAQAQRRRAAAARGQLTKMRNRVARGLCPQQSCRRSFTNLHDHVKCEHPEMLGVLDDDD